MRQTQLALKIRLRRPAGLRTPANPPPKAVVSPPEASVTAPTPPHLSSSSSPGEWASFVVVDNYLRLAHTLQSGQAFRWQTTGEHAHAQSATGRAEEWVGSIENRLFVLRQTVPRPPAPKPDPVWFRHITTTTATVRTASVDDGDDSDDDGLPPPLPEAEAEAEAVAVLLDYFRAGEDFRPLYAGFCTADDNFARLFPYFTGLRSLRQPPEECLCAFICSSNNHIKRISTMVRALADEFGPCIGEYAGTRYHAFPTMETLASSADDRTLRDLGFGYRAKFIASTANALIQQVERDDIASSVRAMLLSWRRCDRRDVAFKLTRLPGVGRKVAACVALMSLDQLGEIPVDTHVWKIAQRYMPGLDSTKSLTLRVHEDVGDFFRERFGEHVAGIAHNFLFVGELPAFQKLLPEELKPGKEDEKKKVKKVKKAETKKGAKIVKSVVKKTSSKSKVKKGTTMRSRKTKEKSEL